MQFLHIITTGGTIDKVYFDQQSDYQIGEPEIGRILTDMNVAFRWNVQPLMRKDSLEITENDRDRIVEAVAVSDATHFLITHGTDTMV
ncbi:MAG: asparaginase domain-containing protein, partial [Pseudomonadota bacterium]